MIYDYIEKSPEGRNRYKITLKIFRDCGPNTAEFDGTGTSPALITVKGADGVSFGVFNIGTPKITRVPPTINSSCMSLPNSVCVEQGIYTYFLELEPRQGGYYVIYQRCCRNNSILNLSNPGRQGSSYYAFIPGPEVAPVNSSPRFVDYPPIFLCNGFDFSYAQAATDPDGDQLIYKFSTPYQGLDDCCPVLGTFPNGAVCQSPPQFCPDEAQLPPYPPVIYKNQFSASNPAPANPPLAINPLTGAMSGAPAMNGQFVISVMVEEYRDGTLISRHFRDFQFNMLQCSGVLSQFKGQEKCQGQDFTFTNTSFNGSTFLWDFGVPGTSDDTSNLQHPAYVYPDTGIFVVTLVVNPGKNCSDTSKKTVRVYPPLDVHFTPPVPMCLSGNRYNFKTEGTWGPFTTFDWFFGQGADPVTSEAINPEGITYSVSGNFNVHLTARHFACVDSVMNPLTVLEMPDVEIEDPGLLCVPATVKFKNNVPSDSDMELIWNAGVGGLSTDPEPSFHFPVAGSYTTQLIGIVHGKCRDTAEMTFRVHDPPAAAFELSTRTVTVLEPEVQLKSLVTEPARYQYDFGDGTMDTFISGVHSYKAEGYYLITQYVTNNFGCSDTATDIVRVLPEHRFWIPDAFTPDNNGSNETFGPILMGVSHYEFEVFDRWGERLFRTNDPASGWDGTFRGKPSPQGVYTYRVVYKNVVDGSPGFRLGHVTLLRSE